MYFTVEFVAKELIGFDVFQVKWIHSTEHFIH